MRSRNGGIKGEMEEEEEKQGGSDNGSDTMVPVEYGNGTGSVSRAPLQGQPQPSPSGLGFYGPVHCPSSRRMGLGPVSTEACPAWKNLWPGEGE